MTITADPIQPATLKSLLLELEALASSNFALEIAISKRLVEANDALLFECLKGLLIARIGGLKQAVRCAESLDQLEHLIGQLRLAQNFLLKFNAIYSQNEG